MTDKKSDSDASLFFDDYKSKITQALVLIAEDNADVREVLKYQLSDAGYRVLEASDGRMAIKMAGKHCPDVILMDINMPVVDGVQATKLIKSNLNQTLANKPIIMLTALSHKEAVIASVNAGANEYVTKPFEIEDIIKKIEKVLKEKGR